MDSTSPDPTPGPPPSLAEIRAHVARLEAAHRAKDLVLSGRVIHVCHHLPVEITRFVPQYSPAIGGSAHLPPTTPEFKPEDQEVSTESHDAQWKIHSRTAHTAMISGIRSLSKTHEQIVVAWTGEVLLQTQSEPTPTLDNVTTLPHLLPSEKAQANGLPSGEMNGGFKTPVARPLSVFGGEFNDVEKQEIESELQRFTEVEAAADNRGKLRYVPVFLPPEVSKGHYEGFCKKSEQFLVRKPFADSLQLFGLSFTISSGSTRHLLSPPLIPCGSTITAPIPSLRPESPRYINLET